MSVKLIDPNERFKFVIDETTIYYRRLSIMEKKDITTRFTTKGNIDFTSSGIAMLKMAIIDWKGIEDRSGKEVKFEPEKILLLPDDVTTPIIELLNAVNGEIDVKKSKDA